jgi:hypothetical protein
VVIAAARPAGKSIPGVVRRIFVFDVRVGVYVVIASVSVVARRGIIGARLASPVIVVVSIGPVSS